MRLEALGLFLRAYLHQDWDYEYPDVVHALADFLANEPEASMLVGEIDALLAEEPTEEELYRLFNSEIRSSFFPNPDQGTAAQWLEMIREYVRRNQV